MCAGALGLLRFAEVLLSIKKMLMDFVQGC